MIFKDMNLQELIAYKASVEVYGTASELAEVVSVSYTHLTLPTITRV